MILARALNSINLRELRLQNWVSAGRMSVMGLGVLKCLNRLVGNGMCKKCAHFFENAGLHSNAMP